MVPKHASSLCGQIVPVTGHKQAEGPEWTWNFPVDMSKALASLKGAAGESDKEDTTKRSRIAFLLGIPDKFPQWGPGMDSKASVEELLIQIAAAM